MTEEGPPIHDTTEQADAAAGCANVTHADVHAVDVPVVVDHDDFSAAPIPGPSGLQSGAATIPRQSLSVEGMCTMLTRTIYTGYTSVLLRGLLHLELVRGRLNLRRALRRLQTAEFGGKGRRPKRQKKTTAVRSASGKKRKTKKQATPESSDNEDVTWPGVVCGRPF